MSMLDRLVSAEQSSDLRHHYRPCDVDVLGAAGMAANYTHMALFRVKYLRDRADLEPAKRIFIQWARRSMVARQVDPAGASRVGVQALMQWLNNVCKKCNGVRYIAIEGAPSLSGKACPACYGSGQRKLQTNGIDPEVFKDILSRAESACDTVQMVMSKKYGRNAT